MGFDRNSQPDSVAFFDAGSGFEVLGGSTRGAIMIRPLLSGADVMPTATREPVAEQFVTVYPNPTAGQLNIQPLGGVSVQELSYRLYAANGQQVDRGTGRRTLDLADLPPGMYLLACRWGERVSQHRIIRH